MRICSRAVEIDPYYADAWALLAIAQSSLRYDFGRDIDDGFAAANAALSIDPDIPAGAPADRQAPAGARRCTTRRPPRWKWRSGLAPNSWEVNKEAGRFYPDHSATSQRATRHYEKAVELMESDFHAWAMLSTCYQALGRHSEAARGGEEDGVRIADARFSRTRATAPRSASSPAAMRCSAKRRRRREWIDRALLVDPGQPQHALQFRLRSRRDLRRQGRRAEDAAESTLATAGAYQVSIAETDTDLDSLREDPRFQKMIAEARSGSG